MTSDLAPLIEGYLTCELLTVSRDGTPIAWPTSGVLRADGTFVVSTSIGLAQKALNVRRDPRVAVLFSDPTGHPERNPAQVLLRGAATCTDVVESGFVSHADLWRRLLAIQRDTQGRSLSAAYTALMDVYFMRLFVTIRPREVAVGPAPRVACPEGTAAPRSPRVLRDIIAELDGYESVVLAAFDASGTPTLERVTVTVGSEALYLTGGALREGRANILAHRHNSDLGDLRSFVATGELLRHGDRWALTPDKFVPGVRGGLVASIRFVWNLRVNAARYLARRKLPRPVIDWHELEELAR